MKYKVGDQFKRLGVDVVLTIINVDSYYVLVAERYRTYYELSESTLSDWLEKRHLLEIYNTSLIYEDLLHD